MSITPFSKYDLALHGVPLCAVCNKPVERMESMYDIAWARKRFRVFCHGQMEESMLDDVTIEDSDSIRMGQAFVDTLVQPQLEQK
jgi:hypothetical protein